MNFWSEIDARLRALEARAKAEDSIAEYLRAVLGAIEELRSELEALPNYKMRLPNMAELPIGVEIALRAEGVIENARFEARKGKKEPLSG